MRNIHILPTDKSSRLHTYKGVLNLAAGEFVSPTIVKNDLINLNIYITSNEEIKEGDWVIKISSLYKGGGIAQKYSFIDAQFEDIIFKKIILTTDPDLIADGVQAIPNEFLEWFVKNPSCERVEVVKGKMQLNDDGQEYGFPDMSLYKIIIPQEEPKQETLEEFIKSQPYYGYCTTEYKEGIEVGAKWQAERMYSEEEVKKLIVDFLFTKRIGREVGSVKEWFEKHKKK
jgi:hypothetical protein